MALESEGTSEGYIGATATSSRDLSRLVPPEATSQCHRGRQSRIRLLGEFRYGPEGFLW